jgi:hypothetical protein
VSKKRRKNIILHRQIKGAGDQQQKPECKEMYIRTDDQQKTRNVNLDGRPRGSTQYLGDLWISIEIYVSLDT